MTDSNIETLDVLKNYITYSNPPHYAVLVKGPWGCGKTHVVDTFLAKEIGDRRGALKRVLDGHDDKIWFYVSLYGASSIKDIHAAIISEVLPATNNNYLSFGMGLIKTGLSFFGGSSELDFSILAKIPDNAIYVFDDLERAKLDINEIFGFVNTLVEHGDHRVILIAHEEKISGAHSEAKTNDGAAADENGAPSGSAGASENSYFKRREKVIGRVLTIQSDIEEAFIYFVSRVESEEASGYFQSRKAKLVDVYRQSGTENLRGLQQSLWDVERLYKCLNEAQKSKPDALEKLVLLFFALCLQQKSGEILRADIQAREGHVTLRGGPETPLSYANDRYSAINLFDPILSSELLEPMLFDGIFSKDKIQRHLETTLEFGAKEAVPNWKILTEFYVASEDAYLSALNTAKMDLAAGAIKAPGELLHILSAMVQASRNGLIEEDEAALLESFKTYIAARVDDGSLKYDPEVGAGFRGSGFGGYTFASAGEQFHKDFAETLRQACQDIREQRVAGCASDLLGKIQDNDIDGFASDLTSVTSIMSRYVDDPVLAKIDRNAFVDAFVALTGDQKETVLGALIRRYRGRGGIDTAFPGERPWLSAVRDELENRKSEMSGFESARTDWQIKHRFGLILGEKEN